jgi:tRNA-modifying protein YgfZ
MNAETEHNPFFLTELNNYSAIDITGADAAKFLQGQLTINVSTPTNSKSYLAALCNPKGRIVSLFHIVAIDQGFRLIMPQTIIDSSMLHLKKYGVFFKVEIVEAPISSIFGLINSTTKEFSEISSLLDQAYYQLNELPMAFIVTSDNSQARLLAASLKTSVQPVADAWFSSLARNKVCWLSENTSGEFLPHNLDLPNLNAVDFKKGCFTGQEVIARMHYKAKIKQKLQLFQSVEEVEATNSFAQAIANEKLLQQDSKVGEVICSCLSEEKRWLVLALVKDSANKQQNFTVNIKNSPILELVE